MQAILKDATTPALLTVQVVDDDEVQVVGEVRVLDSSQVAMLRDNVTTDPIKNRKSLFDII